MKTYVFNINPMGAKRMTQRSKWLKKNMDYLRYKDALRQEARRQNLTLPAKGLKIVFYMPIAASKSNKKKLEMINTPHMQRPDIDNLAKGVFDALCEEDGFIYECSFGKYWGMVGRIVIQVS